MRYESSNDVLLGFILPKSAQQGLWQSLARSPKTRTLSKEIVTRFARMSCVASSIPTTLRLPFYRMDCLLVSKSLGTRSSLRYQHENHAPLFETVARCLEATWICSCTTVTNLGSGKRGAQKRTQSVSKMSHSLHG